MFHKINKKYIFITIVIIGAIIIIAILNCTNKENEILIDTIEDNITIEPTPKEIDKIIVHITGAIKNPGLVEINLGSRIADIIEAAGGITNEADISKVNLAYIVKDAQKIYIPSIYDEQTVEYISEGNGNNIIVEDKEKGEQIMININSATQTELEQLSGIGPSTALKIIDYRNKNGKFKSIDEIKEVPGIGDSKFNNIKDNIEI